ncbi:MAG: glycosyltransferase family 4 protein [Candidatus Magasanikbacteria bacterium]|jgi:glycosyltransferase involved in cell wall biosynthesis|nr:glycosyltransferase family 4 protein [Candidatus Magasanikbacteria bacterium]
MKILYLITKSEAGGAQSHVYELCKYFGKKNEVVLMSFPGGWLEDQSKDLNIKFVSNKYFSNSINPFKVFKAIKLVKNIVKEFNPDIVHCHSSGAGFIGRLTTRNKIPTIFTAHGWGFNIGVPFLQKQIAILAEKFVSKYSVKIITVSEFVRKLGIKNKIAKKEKFEIIYNGIKSKVIPTGHQYSLKSKKSKVNEKIKIVFVGRLAEPKDPIILVKAYEELSNELKEKSEIIIIGGGPKKIELEKFIVQNKVKNVNLLGSLSRDQVFDMVNESDVFVLVSKYEGLPMTILEAMSFGLPVVASDVGGVGEIIEDGINGFLLKNNSAEELKESLEKLIIDKRLREKMGAVSIEKVLSEFSIDKMLKKTEELYNKVICK